MVLLPEVVVVVVVVVCSVMSTGRKPTQPSAKRLCISQSRVMVETLLCSELSSRELAGSARDLTSLLSLWVVSSSKIMGGIMCSSKPGGMRSAGATVYCLPVTTHVAMSWALTACNPNG